MSLIFKAEDEIEQFKAEDTLFEAEGECEVAVRADSRAEALLALTRTKGIPLVETLQFNVVIGLAIIVNGLLIGLECDMDLGTAGIFFNNLFTAIWTIEMVLRLRQGVRPYFRESWNRLDFVLAWFSIIDTWLLPLLVLAGLDGGLNLGQFSVLRLARIMRIARIAKVVRAFNELRLLVNGLIKALGVLSWVIMLLLIVVYVAAIFMTQIVGQACEGETYADYEDCFSMFGNMPRSMWSLLELLTSGEIEMARPIVERTPWLVLFFLIFLYTTTFGLMNIVLGVIVDQVISASHENAEKVKKRRAQRDRQELSILRGLFELADVDRDSMVTLKEFLDACEKDEVREAFEKMGFAVSRKRIAKRLFEVLDVNCKGSMKIDDILERIFRLKTEGRMATEDLSLLLMDVRHLHRRFDHFELQLPVLKSDREVEMSLTTHATDMKLPNTVDTITMQMNAKTFATPCGKLEAQVEKLQKNFNSDITESNAESLPTMYSKLEKVEVQVQKILDTIEAQKTFDTREASAEAPPISCSPYGKLEKVEAQVQKIVDTMEANATSQLFLAPYNKLEAKMEKLQTTFDIMEASAEVLPISYSPYGKLEKIEAQVQKIVDIMEANATPQLFPAPYNKLEAQMEKLQKTFDIMEANAEPLPTANGKLEAQVEKLQNFLDTMAAHAKALPEICSKLDTQVEKLQKTQKTSDITQEAE